MTEHRRVVPFKIPADDLHGTPLYRPEDDTLVEGKDFYYRLTEYGFGPYFFDPGDNPAHFAKITELPPDQLWDAGFYNIFMEWPAFDRVVKAPANQKCGGW